MTRSPAPARRLALVAAAALLPTLAVTTTATAAPRASGHASLRADLLARAGGHGHFAAARSGGPATFFGTSAGHAARRPATLRAGAPAAAAARAWMASYGAVFGVRDARRDLHVQRTSAAPGGVRVVRMAQTVDGLPVVGGGLTVTLDGHDDLLSVNGRTTSATASSPVVPAAAARSIAVRAVVKHDAAGVDGLHATRPVLSVLDQSLFGAPVVTGPETVWSVHVASRGASVRRLVFVDATNGGVALDIDENSHATARPHRLVCRPAAGNDHRIKNPRCAQPNNNSQVKVIATESNPPSRSARDAYNAFRFAGAVWRFYDNLLGRNSLDNHGMPLASTVHFCPPRSQGVCPYDNAFWDGHEMVYGAGYTTALDVVGHEMTHGVTQHTSNLLSYYQSGAINESMSDTMGELIQQIEGPGLHAYDANDAWLVGEDLPIGAVRDMAFPTNDNPRDPDRMTSRYYSALDAYKRYWDNGGVHANAGVGNKAAYLIAAGPNGDGTLGTFNGRDLTGVTPAGTTRSAVVERDVKTANIYYQLDRSMWSATTYKDLYSLLPQVCHNLAGKPLRMPDGSTASFTISDVDDCPQVQAAVDATEMNLDPKSDKAAIPTPVQPCTNGGAPAQQRRDRFETNPFGNGSYSRAQDGSRDRFGDRSFGRFWWSNTYIDYYGSKPPKYQPKGSSASLYGDDADPQFLDPNNRTYDREDAWARMSHPVSASVGTYVRFQHAWEFDYGPPTSTSKPTYYDGGRVEYSVDGGKRWYDAAAASSPAGRSLFAGNGYNGTLASYAGDANPLRNRKAFVGSSHGWTASRLDLSSLAGKHVLLRWRIGADNEIGSLGWYVDDVWTYGCDDTATTLSADPTTVLAGDSTTLHAQLVRAGTATSLEGQTVRFYRRPAGAATWTFLGSALVNGGDAQLTDAPPGPAGSSFDYQARFPGVHTSSGATNLRSSSSSPVRVSVS